MNDQRQRANGEWIGLTLFTLGAFTAVLVCMVLFKDTPRDAASGTAALGWSVVGGLGTSAALLLSVGLAALGAMAFLGLVRAGLLRHAGGVAGSALGLSVLLGALSMEGGGSLGAFTGGNLTALGSVLVGAGFGLCALLAPLWLAWGSLLPERQAKGGRQEGIVAVLSEKHADGVTEAEAAALMPAAQDKTNLRRGPETPPNGAQTTEFAETETIQAPAPSPYPEDVRRRGGIPKGATPLKPDATARTVTTDEPIESKSTHDLAAVEAGPAEDDDELLAPGEDLVAPSPGEDFGADEERRARLGDPESEPEPEDLGGEEEPLAGSTDGAGDADEDGEGDEWEGEDDTPGDELAVAVPAPSWEQPALFTDIEPEVFTAQEADREEGPVAAEDTEAVAEDEQEEYEAAELGDEEEAEGEEYEEAEEDEDEEDEEDEEEAAELEDEEGAEEEEEVDEEEYEEAAELEDEEEEEEEEEADEEEYEEAVELEDEEEYEEEYEEEDEEEEEEEEEADEEECEEAAELEGEEEAGEAEVTLEPQAPPDPAQVAGDDPQAAAELMVSQAGALLIEEGRVAVSMLQKRFSIDFDDACRMLDTLQELGLIGLYQGGQTREILMTAEEWAARTVQV